MCTAVSYRTGHHYFGRNLDLERGYGEAVVITPRRFPFAFRYAAPLEQHYALIGMAAVAEGYPLYFEATNETGLSMAGLNFPHCARYGSPAEDKENLAPFELIPRLLGCCATAAEARKRLEGIRVVDCSFSPELPVTPLHWLVADREEAFVLECTEEGMKLHPNPYGVLTNSPAFDFHLTNLCRYMALHEGAAQNRLLPGAALNNFSLGLGAVGLPGDFSSCSRFVRAVFVRAKSVCGSGEEESVNQFFHILQAVAMPRGCVLTPDGKYEYTRYSCCCNTDTQVYYHTTYRNMTPRKTPLRAADLNAHSLTVFPMEA